MIHRRHAHGLTCLPIVRANQKAPFRLFFFKQKTAYEISACLVGSEMCIRDREWACGSMSRLEEERLSFSENSPLQQRLATDRSIRNSSNGENPGKILPASHPGSPATVSYTHLTLPTKA